MFWQAYAMGGPLLTIGRIPPCTSLQGLDSIKIKTSLPLSIMEEQINADEILKDRIPARLDLWQSVTGGILGLFIGVHLFFDSSILLGPQAMYRVSKGLEGQFLDPEGKGWPILVSLAALGILLVFMAHAGLALRKFPASWRQYKAFATHMHRMQHAESSAWLAQVITGFIMFFFGSAHLLYMVFFPGGIGPFLTAERIYGQGMFFFYLILLFAVVIHAAAGLYRVGIKWGLFCQKNPRHGRVILKNTFRAFSAFFLILGTLALLAYGKLGYERKNAPPGERFQPEAHAKLEVQP